MISTPGPYNHNAATVQQQMIMVVVALVPGSVIYTYFFGWGLLINMLIATSTALICEFLFLRARGRNALPAILDGSALVTAALLALALPPLVPWWTTVIGTSFAIIFAKQMYGGLGYNPFNPAMAGYVLLLISFPREMTIWPSVAEISGHYAGIWDSLLITFTGSPGGVTLDVITGATPLDYMKTSMNANASMEEVIANPLFGDFGGRGWEWVANGFFLGGIWLIYKKVITWHIPVAVLSSLIIMSLIFYAIDPGAYPSPMFHVFSGGAMLGAFFIATDPVSAATTPKGRIFYGVGIGVLIYVIRTWGGYPDAVAFSVLLMNMVAPTLDRYTQPTVFGHEKDRRAFGHNDRDDL